MTSSGLIFISADYRLIPPATGHDIVADIKDLFTFLDHDVNGLIRGRQGKHVFEIDSSALAVAGSSAGALCAYLAAMHASPKPRAVLSLYGMGGDMLVCTRLEPHVVHGVLIRLDVAIPRDENHRLLPWPRDARSRRVL